MAPTEAQADLRRAHVNGGAGVLVSGLAWLAAAFAFLAAGPKPAFITLFVCGLAIAPVALGLAMAELKVGRRLVRHLRAGHALTATAT